jgi:hypothetical protein
MGSINRRRTEVQASLGINARRKIPTAKKGKAKFKHQYLKKKKKAKLGHS